MRWKEGYNLDYLIEYDESNPISIEKYAQRLIGKTFADVCNQDDLDKSIVVHETSDYETSHENKKRKGGLGEIIEERFFHYQCNNDSRPDFYKAGVELKVTPYKVNKNGTLVAKERLIITMIDYFSVIEETFESSHMWNKAKLILLIYYLYQQEIQSRLDYRIGYVWYTLNDKMGWINLGNNQVISFEGFIKLVDLLFQNEDCKYYYKNIVIDKKDKYKLSSGRTNSSAANLFILNYLEGNVKLSKLLDAFQKSRGVPMIKKSDYSVVTDKIVINVDIESR